MSASQTQKNKNRLEWNDYEGLDGEPAYKQAYDLTPEVEKELLERGLFLKQRIRRNIRRMRHERRVRRIGHDQLRYHAFQHRHKVA